jgi:uncharacterized protein
MNIRELSQELQKIYEDMAQTFSHYQNASGLHCLSGCGKCCTNPEIEATVLEMLPAALKIYDEQKMEEWLERLENPSSPYCLFYLPHNEDGSQGQCQSYKEGPSVCRMFAVAGYFDKQHEATLSVCKLIKEKYPDLTKLRSSEANLENTPMLASWSYQVTELNPTLSEEKMPINQALKRALEKVALYAQYQSL